MVCEICASTLLEQQCPVCTEAIRERFRMMQPGSFPMTAMPPEGLLSVEALGALRRSLLSDDLADAERLWTQLLSTLRPLGEDGRRQLAEALEACAALKDALGKDGEAQRLRQRAATARKDPHELHRKQAGPSRSGAPGWDNNAWQRLQSDDATPDRQAAIARVKAEMEKAEARAASKKRVLHAGAFGLVGVAGVSALGAVGLPALASGAVGAGLGWMLSRNSKP